MSIFNIFNKKNKEEIKVNEEDISVIENSENEKNKFSLICINLDIDDYSFIVKLNDDGTIIINKSLGKDQFVDKQKVNEIYDVIDNNLKKIKELVTQIKPNSKTDNMIQVEIGKNKYVLFRNEDNADVSLFYDMLIHEITNILNINKVYEMVKSNFSFEYPNNYEKIPNEDLSKYCLLSNSEPLIMLNDNKNILTFEILKANLNEVEKIIEDINESKDYEKMSTIDLEHGYFKIKTLVVNYIETNKIETLSFIMFEKKCILFTMMIGDKEEIEIENLLENNKIKEMINIIKSFKILDEDIINT